MNSITINGTQYPCSVCWAAIEKLIEQKGSCSLNALQNPKMWKPQDITTLMFWSLYYGCQATEGAPVFPFTHDSFSTVIGMAEVTAFMKILAEQTDSHLKKEKDTDSKKKRRRWIIFR